MQDQLPPNKTGNERGMLDPASTLTETDFRNIVNEIRTQEAST